MKVIGYSGLHNSLSFRRENFDNFNEQEYRMCQGLDSAACIFVDGKLIAAAEEERFNGEKYTCDFPKNTIDYCLSEAGLKITEIDYICHGFDYASYERMYSFDKLSYKYYQEVLSVRSQINLWNTHYSTLDIYNKFIPVSHHMAHAASAFYPSGFDNALIIVADGLGEENSISIMKGNDNKLTLLKKYNVFSSLGILYSQITAHLGFLVNSDEYKVMGLAPYGDPKPYDRFFSDLIEYLPDGEIIINAFCYNRTALEKQTYRGFKNWLTSKTFVERDQYSSLEQKHKDLAASLQQHLEKAMMHVILHWKNITKYRNLCMAGGVALNCVYNGLLLKEKYFENIYIPSASGDAGTALGAGLVKMYESGVHLISAGKMDLPYYGPGISNEACILAIEQFSQKIHYRYLSDDELINYGAKYISNGMIIAWVQGRMEFGPRALGNRSILANPSCSMMREKINLLVKKREEFRPFAPAVVVEKASIYFDIKDNLELPYMLFTVPVRAQFQGKLPAITHVNGSARLQTVSQDHAPQFWALIDKVGYLTGMPIVLNTSFNIKGQPIVRTAIEAIETFITAGLDALFLGNYLITLQQ